MIADFLIGISGFAIVFGVPFVILVYPRQPRWPETLAGRIMMTILIVWILVVIHRVISLPVVRSRAEEQGIPGYDSIPVNIGIYFFGWFLGIMGLLPSLLVRLVLVWKAQQKLQPPSRLRH